MWERSAAFWETRDAWRVTAAAKTRGRRADYSLEAKAARWAVKTEEYLRAVPSVAGAVRIQSADVRAALQTHLDSLGAELAASFDAHLPWVAAAAFVSWPVRSGFSKGTIELYYRETGGASFTGGIAVLAPYAILIKGGPHRRLVSAPVRQVTPAIMVDFLRRLEARNG